jgi:hypothetical protein
LHPVRENAILRADDAGEGLAIAPPKQEETMPYPPLFERALSVPAEDLELELRGIREIAWGDFWLNPRRLRGSDFLMRWSQGVWAERLLVDAVNGTENFFAVPYGPSGTAPKDDVRSFELYFERLEAAGLGAAKRPDLLIFNSKDKPFVDNFIEGAGGGGEPPFTPEPELRDLISKAVVAIECENSLWVAERMKDYKTEMKPQRRLGGKMGLPKTAILPNVIVKEEDWSPLSDWQTQHGVPIHIWQVFYDRAYGLSFGEAQRLVDEKLILPKEHTYQAPNGATTKKLLYYFYYRYAYLLGTIREKPKFVAEYIEDKNGHILPYVRFEGGSMEPANEAMDILRSMGGD